MSRIAVDFDGTLVEKAWPSVGDFLPGAIDAMKLLHAAGHSVFLYSARLSPVWPDGSERSPGELESEINAVRNKLDEGGLAFMDIYTGPGKPHWDVLIDDKVMWYSGRPGSWKSLVPKILVRVKDEDSYATVMDIAEFGGVTEAVLREETDHYERTAHGRSES